MVSSSNSGENNLERMKRLQAGHCCWHCRYYIRTIDMIVDGPATSVCTIDRAYKNMYECPSDKERKPDEYCDQFEMDIPTSLG